MTEFIYRPDNYRGPVALDATPSKECRKYHENSCVQINLAGKTEIRPCKAVLQPAHEIQGSASWLAFRKGKITASKIGAIMGLSPYQTPYGLWEEELGLRDPQPCLPHMQAGLDCEDEAREWYFTNYGYRMLPKVVIHPDNDQFMASLDGISPCGNFILEIKRNNKDFHEMARSGKIIDFHRKQILWQMYCAGEQVEKAYYLSYRKDDEIVVEVTRNDDEIAEMVEQANKFLLMVANLTPPPLCERDYIDLRDNKRLPELLKRYTYSLGQHKYYKDDCESLKEEIVAECQSRCSIGPGFRLTKYPIKGKIDYKDLFYFYRIADFEQEKFRKPNTQAYRITLE